MQKCQSQDGTCSLVGSGPRPIRISGARQVAFPGDVCLPRGRIYMSHPPCVNKGSHSSDLRTQGNTTQVSACLTRFHPGNMAFPERTALNNPVFQKQEKENSPTNMSLRRKLLHWLRTDGVCRTKAAAAVAVPFPAHVGSRSLRHKSCHYCLHDNKHSLMKEHPVQPHTSWQVPMGTGMVCMLPIQGPGCRLPLWKNFHRQNFLETETYYLNFSYFLHSISLFWTIFSYFC